MRITHIQGIFSPEHGGPAYSLANFCLEQNRLGHQVSLRVLDGYANTSKARLLDPSINQRCCQVSFPERLGFSWDLPRILKLDDPQDIYHLHGSWLLAMQAGAAEAASRRKPYLVELMGSYTDYELRRKPFRKALARLLYQDRILRSAACLHVNAPEEGKMLRKLGFKNPIACLPVGVDVVETRRLLSEIAQGQTCRSRPYVLYLGRIHPTKGLEELISAWRQVSVEVRDWQLVIAGCGEVEYEARCKLLSRDLVDTDACEWIGRVDEEEKVRLYRDAGAYVLPSLNENFGNTVAEALTCETPVITTFNTQWTMLEARECGWLATPDADSLAQAILRCLRSGATEQKRRGLRGRMMVESEYSIEVVVANMVELYRGIIGGSIPSRLLI